MIQRRPARLLLLLATCALAVRAQEPDPPPDPGDRPDRIFEALESGDARRLAWGAWRAGKLRPANAKAALLQALKRIQGPASGPATGGSPSAKAAFPFILDALLRLGERVPAALLEPYLTRRHPYDPAVLLLLRDPRPNADRLLDLCFGPRPHVNAFLRIHILNLLVEARAPGLGGRVLSAWRPRVLLLEADEERVYGGMSMASTYPVTVPIRRDGYPPLGYWFVRRMVAKGETPDSNGLLPIRIHREEHSKHPPARSLTRIEDDRIAHLCVAAMLQRCESAPADLRELMSFSPVEVRVPGGRHDAARWARAAMRDVSRVLTEERWLNRDELKDWEPRPRLEGNSRPGTQDWTLRLVEAR